jgi:hypothetical protein
MLAQCYKKEDQEFFIAGLTAFEEEAKKSFGDNFIYCKPEDQIKLTTTALQAAIQEKKENKEAKIPFILSAKELTMLGYFSSEPGATQVLQYEAVPGKYNGCIPLNEAGNGKTWATG